MKVERIGDEIINIFINKSYFKDIILTNKLDLISIIKELVNKIEIRYHLNLNGFYKIKVYPHERIGVFLDIIKIDDNEFSNGADFRIVVYQNEKFYFETEDFECIENSVQKRYYNHNFYVQIDDISDIKKIIDMGRIIYGDEVKEMLMRSKFIK